MLDCYYMSICMVIVRLFSTKQTLDHIVTVTLGFDYARRHNGIIATKLVCVSTLVCLVMQCRVQCYAGPRSTYEGSTFDCVIRAPRPWQARNMQILSTNELKNVTAVAVAVGHLCRRRTSLVFVTIRTVSRTWYVL